MSRYRGPRIKVVRRLGTELPGLTQRRTGRLDVLPGQQTRRRRRPSPYALRLKEKQILRFNYGVSERQMRNLFKKASRQRGNTGHNLLTLLESRLDSVVCRAGFAPTIPAARQLVSHGHIMVNGRKMDVPSYEVQVGDTVSIREKSRSRKNVAAAVSQFGRNTPSFIGVDAQEFSATLSTAPDPAEVMVTVDTSLVVEFYSR